jgi:hypothetical protein
MSIWSFPLSDSIYQVSTDTLIESPLYSIFIIFLISNVNERIWRSVNHIMAHANFNTDAAFCLGRVQTY